MKMSFFGHKITAKIFRSLNARRACVYLNLPIARFHISLSLTLDGVGVAKSLSTRLPDWIKIQGGKSTTTNNFLPSCQPHLLYSYIPAIRFMSIYYPSRVKRYIIPMTFLLPKSSSPRFKSLKSFTFQFPPKKKFITLDHSTKKNPLILTLLYI